MVADVDWRTQGMDEDCCTKASYAVSSSVEWILEPEFKSKHIQMDVK